MSRAATELIHLPSAGTLAACRAVSDAVYPHVKRLYDAGEIRGYTLAVVKDAEDADATMLPNNHLDITNGIYPFLYVVIQPREEDSEFERRLSFLSEGEYQRVINK